MIQGLLTTHTLRPFAASLLIGAALLGACSGGEEATPPTDSPTEPGVTDPPDTATQTAPPAQDTPTATQAPVTTPTATVPPVVTPTATQEPVSTPTAGQGDTPTAAPVNTPTAAPVDTPTAAPVNTPTQPGEPTPPLETQVPDLPTPPPPTPWQSTFYVYKSYPARGAMAVPHSTLAQFYFSEEFTGVEGDLSLTLTRLSDGDETHPTVKVRADKLGAYSSPPLSLYPETSYCLKLTGGSQGPLNYTTCFTTAIPCGVAAQIGYNTHVETFGGGNAVVTFLNGALTAFTDDLRIALMFQGEGKTTTFPASGLTIVTGEYDAGPPAKVDSLGWTSSAQGCTIAANGDFTCHADEMIFPLPLDDNDPSTNDLTLSLYLKDVTLTAKAKTSGNFTDLDTFVLSGHMLYDDVVRLAAEAASEEVAALVKLDLDTDGDGDKDAATFRLTSAPEPLVLQGCDASTF